MFSHRKHDKTILKHEKGEKVMNKFVLKQSLILLLTATIWGFAFVAQSVSMEYVGAFTFNAVRNLIGAIVLIPCIAVLKKTGTILKTVDNSETVKERIEPTLRRSDRTLLIGGVSCGILLFVASNLQQFGIQYTTVGKAGFITAMYIVIVPILGIFLKKRAGNRVWIGVVIAVMGLYMLCMTGGGFALQKGDLLMLFCALVFSLHILVIDYFALKVDGVKMSCIQFLVCAVLSGVCMCLFEEPELPHILQAWVPVLYAGILSCGVGYTLQIIGQRGMNPTVASLILSLESVISVIAGWIILGQALSGRELLGCVLMFVAMVLVQLPESGK